MYYINACGWHPPCSFQGRRWEREVVGFTPLHCIDCNYMYQNSGCWPLYREGLQSHLLKWDFLVLKCLCIGKCCKINWFCLLAGLRVKCKFNPLTYCFTVDTQSCFAHMVYSILLTLHKRGWYTVQYPHAPKQFTKIWRVNDDYAEFDIRKLFSQLYPGSRKFLCAHTVAQMSVFASTVLWFKFRGKCLPVCNLRNKP